MSQLFNQLPKNKVNPFKQGGAGNPFTQPSGQPGTQPFDFNTWMKTAKPEDIATLLGQDQYQPGYNSNQQGSFETNYNNVLNTLNPDQLIQRYQKVGAGQLRSSMDQANSSAYNTFKSMMGRDPTSGEFSSILPAFQGPNGIVGGRAAVADMQRQYKLNPGIDPNSPQNKSTPADFTKQISDTFQATVGRAPTANELAHFQQQFQSGQLDAYGLEGVIKQSPEYTNAADTKFRSGLNDQLAGYDATAFNRMGAPQLFAKYAQNGMPTGSSPSLDYAMTDLMERMTQNRSQYLAQLSAQQYGGNKDLATSNYQNTSNQFMNAWANNLNGSQNMTNALLNRGYNGLDYTQQQNDFMKYSNDNRQNPNNTLNYINTGLNAINTGANLFSRFSSPMSYGQVGGSMGQIS